MPEWMNVWPNPEELFFVVLKPLGVNVVSETNSTFATSKPDRLMKLPLIQVNVVPGVGRTNLDVDRNSSVDVACFAPDRDQAWALYNRVHARLLAMRGRPTILGAFDDLWFENEPAVIPYSNPSVRRVVATYGITTRAVGVAQPAEDATN